MTKTPEWWRQWEGLVIETRFPLQQYLGSSDHSAVFLTGRGEDSSKAVIKLVPGDGDRAKAMLTRWERCGEVSHPHLVTLFERGMCRIGDAPMCYQVMEACDEDLSQILPQRPLTAAESTEMLRAVVGAVGYLHQKGLVHSRIKPSNIMAVKDQIKISSDCLRSAGEADDGGRAVSVYDAPEVTESGATAPGDIWSLGITVVECLTQHPFVWKDAAHSLQGVRERLPAPFDEIASHCLRRDPKQRWNIEDVAEGVSPASPRPVELVRVGPSKSLPGLRILLPGLAIVLVAVLFGGTRLLHRSEKDLATRETPSSAPAERQPTPPSGGLTSQTGIPQSGTIEGAVAHEVLPNVPLSARRTIKGVIRVRLKLKVDSLGDVTGTKFESKGPSQYFARLAEQAAREWKFVPAQENGQPRNSEWMVRFEFGRIQTRAIPSPMR